MHHDRDISKNIQRKIKGSKKEVTILFTDIESSGKYWDSRGDIKGRLLIDYHNRLIFPIIKKFHGKIVKTIGDAIMASFKGPANAVKAAIAVQQLLQRERKKNKHFPKVRIGIHTGRALVEKEDVFGDMVNIASRIENRAKGNEILLSSRTARKTPQKKLCLEKKEQFRPKGKKNKITLYRCNWRKAPDLIDKINLDTLLTLHPLQKWEILGATLASITMFIFLYLKYVRYLFSDSETLALLALNPKYLITQYPLIALFVLLLLSLITFLILKMKRIPLVNFKLINGGLGFSIVFFLFYVTTTIFSIDIGLKSDVTLFRSTHLFVEIVDHNAPIHSAPTKRSTVLRTVPKGMLLLQADVREQGNTIWNKVLIGKNKYGWVLRIDPPKLGVPEKRISSADKFYFKYKDVYNLMVGIIGFILGFFHFKIRPA